MNKLTEGENPKDGGLKDGGLKDGGLKDGGLKDGMLRLLFVDTGRTRKNKAAPDRVHTAMLDTRLVIIHPQESALDVLLERIAVAFSHNEGSPMDRIQSGWVHSRGSGDRFSVRILGVSENMADIVRAQAAAEKWPTLLWNRQTDDITLPDGVSLGAANAGDASQTGVSLPSRVFFAPAPERTGCSTAPSAIPEGFLLASFNRARGFTIGFWASAFDENLKSGLSPLGVSDHQRRLAFTAVTLLRKGQRPAIERQHLRTAFHTVHETGLIVSDRGWAPRRYLPGPGFAAALERQSPGWVACGRAVHAAVARSNPFEAFTVIDALEKGGLPSEKNNPLFPKQTAHQNLAADALLETVKQTILSQLDPLGASLSIMVKKWRETAKA